MRFARLCLVLLLSVLLPLRGALAAAMACPEGGAGEHAVAQVDGTPACDESNDAAMPDDMAMDDASAATMPSHDAGHPDKCNACQGCCTGVALPSSQPDIPASTAAVAAAFPDVGMPAASFLADGQERPPRSL